MKPPARLEQPGPLRTTYHEVLETAHFLPVSGSSMKAKDAYPLSHSIKGSLLGLDWDSAKA